MYLDHWHLSDYWYGWIAIYHICYCFPLLALVSTFVFYILSAFCGFNWAFHIFPFSLLLLITNYTLKTNFFKTSDVLLLYADVHPLCLFPSVFCDLWLWAGLFLLLLCGNPKGLKVRRFKLQKIHVCFCYDSRGFGNDLRLLDSPA